MKLFCFLLMFFFISYNYLLCELEFPITASQLEIKGNAKTILEKETTVKGTKDNLIRKQVISEIFYEIISPNNVLIKYHNNEGITSNYSYTKNHTPQTINRTITSNNKPVIKTVFQYDSVGKPSAELIYSAEGKLKDSVAISYDSNNNATIKHYYNANKTQYKLEEKWYNSKGKEIKNIQESGSTTTRIIYQYDKTEENIIAERWYFDGKMVQKVYYNYENGLLISKVDKNEQEEITAQTHYEYDIISGLVISMKTGNNITVYEYNFDANDNWIVKYEFYDDYPVKIIEREITY